MIFGAFEMNVKSLFRRFRISIIHLLACYTKSMPITDYVILAPHPDDETFGCGQLIAEMASRGKEVFLIFFSGGGASHNGCCDLSSFAIETTRCQKAKEILSDLGVRAENMFFLNMPDGELAGSIPSAYLKIKQLIVNMTAATILAPHPQEGWRDHEAVSALAQKLATDTGKILFYYCVWFYFSMPFRKFHHVQWRNACFVHHPEAWRKKTAACRKYLSHLAPCGKPYAGVLPEELIDAISYSKELFFQKQLNTRKNEAAE